MSKSSVSASSSPVGFMLFLVFLVLKLTHVIAWSWLWVTAPLWIPLALVIIMGAVAAVAAVIIASVRSRKRAKQLASFDPFGSYGRRF